MSRVLVVTNDFPTRVGGIESFVLAICRGLDPREVVVYTASMPGAQEYDATLPFPVYRDPSSTLLPTPAVARRVSAVMRRHGCDRIVFGASAPLGLLAPKLRRAGARRIVALTHGHEVWWARVPGARRLLRRIGDSVDVMTFVSEWCRSGIAPALSADAAGRMARLSPGVDPDRFHPCCGGAEVRWRLGIAPETPVVVCAARFVRRKGQDLLVQAWPQVQERFPGARLLLVGDGPGRTRVQRLAAARGVADTVIFAGTVLWRDMPAYTEAGDVFAMPCRSRLLGLEVEAWGIVFLEAQACGRPVLIGDSGGAPETLADDQAGRVVRPRVDAVAEGLITLLDGARDRPRVVHTDWTWAGCSRRLRALLDGSAGA